MRDDIEGTAFSKLDRRITRLEQAGITRISFGPGQRIRIYDEDGVDVGYVGELPSGGFGISYVYDGAVTSAAGIAAVHKATLDYLDVLGASHAITLSEHAAKNAGQDASISYLNGEKNVHAGQIAALQSNVSGLQSGLGSLEGALGALQSTVGGMAGLAELITALDNTNRIQNLKITALENRLDRLDGGGGPANPGT
ncbi:hypothetical protein [Pseudoclavibacter sp. AY1H1]|uniref:hypothetical protein n=1 Tax=Pseudoclavibacter sp. AY1H1 TaxID=2080584 RepID=UPI000CE8348C|nr:hypothetical protein [Pseudoclavibacter sp. AY1H1]PPF38333.1 hypothetical protein C5E05_04795 [Pseudoclavibacter sp. AY1H1]